ncbi:MAG: hypothetical protein K0U98_05220 [Deltaproteobacteria bacterium]|nr:hypothetical protein [Deltaproteobacteria bacterium]
MPSRPHPDAIDKRREHLKEAFALALSVLKAILALPVECKRCNHKFTTLDTSPVRAVGIFSVVGFFLAGILSEYAMPSSFLLIFLELMMLLVIAHRNRTKLHLFELGCSAWVLVWLAQLVKGLALSNALEVTEAFFVDGLTAALFIAFFGLLFDSYITVTRYRTGVVFSPAAGNSSCTKVVLVSSVILVIAITALVLVFSLVFLGVD